MRRKISAVVISLLAITTGFSQERQIPEILLGEWTGRGTLFGNEASFSMSWQKALNGKFIKLIFQNNYTVNGETTVMNAEAFYRSVTDTTFTGTWFDSRGVVLPLHAVTGNNTLSTEWGGAETEKGKTVYEIRSENEMEVKDYILRNGQWQLFGQANYKKKE